MQIEYILEHMRVQVGRQRKEILQLQRAGSGQHRLSFCWGGYWRRPRAFVTSGTVSRKSRAPLRGKLVLIDFWTYTCINWLRTAPYVRAWAEKYKDQGLVVIGVHAPEFAFEKNIDNVRWAVKEMRINYPVAVDNEHTIWRAFRYNYWPALYFIDAQGRLRHHHFGEGSYEQSEKIIQELLAETGAAGIARDPVSVLARGIEAAADWDSLKSRENCLGYDRTQNFASPGRPVLNKLHTYESPARLRLNEWALAGDWTVRSEAAMLTNPMAALPTAFTRAIFILSWARRPRERRCDSAC